MKKREDQLQKAFLPSALEIIETPPSPIGWMTIWIIFLIIIIGIIWSILGQVDEVAIATGRVIPDGKVKVIQTPESGVIISMPVEDGEQVEKGQVLVALDNTMSNIDERISLQEYENLKLEKMILEKELEGVMPNQIPIEATLSNQDSTFINHFVEFRMQSLSSLESRIQILKMQQASAESDYNVSISNYNITEKKIVILEREVKDLKALFETGGTSSYDYQAKVDELDMTKQQLQSLIHTTESTLDKIKQSEASIYNEEKAYRESLLNLIVQKEKEIFEAEGVMNKAKNIEEMHTIVSPVSGQINGLGSNTIGSVITASNPIMTIVPSDTPLIIEGNVANVDIGFIEVGQKVDIKVDTFPFQRYGVIEGEIIFISPDAFQDENIGYYYKIKVKPYKEFMAINGKEMHLSSGMTTKIEVKTGKRRIIEFFLPAADYIKESFELR
ncbi:HlyD family type I secretion periplasmic adaptor subunit [Fusibacter ferrireducens]|uniref:HlyD family type I secretion periplasmic adaptor subunit n=1 Tax=Fusibacter ferrireducens TaxID=2785058 RepID=A0ABR9ZQE7_9FIRM|nr:HlyD family type I secretion periplasmic adaptor subunit [Fusibacter ferrireducens]MBF4692649.1 HlyD family type I secretion periplasmic adaptor subunit [Fusibacter ferrireducens]